MRRLLLRWLGVSLLADELNQFAMQVENYARREAESADARFSWKEAKRALLLFDAARRLRERIGELIDP